MGGRSGASCHFEGGAQHEQLVELPCTFSQLLSHSRIAAGAQARQRPVTLVSKLLQATPTSSFQLAAMQPNTLVLYHYPCPDGIYAVLAAALNFKHLSTSSCVRYVPNRVFAPCTVPDLHLQGHETVFLLDFVGPAGFAQELAAVVHRVVVIDHHKTAQEALGDSTSLPSNLEVNLDMHHSAAWLALQYFKPQVSADLERAFCFIQDGDLWHWKLPGSKAFYAGLRSLKLDYDASQSQDIFDTLEHLQTSAVIQQGEELLQREAELVAAAVQTAFLVELEHPQQGKLRCLAARADHMPDLRSQLGNELATRSQQRGMAAMGLVAYVEAEMRDSSQVKCSLRSIGQLDTTAVAKLHGGGGHLNASSFVTSAAMLRSWTLQP